MNFRAKKLRELIDERFSGSQSDFSKKVKKNETQVNQWLTGFRNMGSTSARDIEAKLHLEQGWFEEFFVGSKADKTAVTDESLIDMQERELVALFRQLSSQEDKSSLIEYLEFKVKKASESRSRTPAKKRA